MHNLPFVHKKIQTAIEKCVLLCYNSNVAVWVLPRNVKRTVLCRLSMNVRIFKEENPMNNIIEAFTSEQMKTEIPKFEIGDTVRVHNRIKEGQRERIQIYEGTVIAKRNGGITETFTVRRISYGVGVEKTFPLHSPNVVKVEVIRSGKVRRAKLFYLRDRVGKSAKVKERIEG